MQREICVGHSAVDVDEGDDGTLGRQLEAHEAGNREGEGMLVTDGHSSLAQTLKAK